MLVAYFRSIFRFLNPASYYQSQHRNLQASRRVLGYFVLMGIFFLLSFLTIYFVHRCFSGGQFHFDLRLLSVKVIGNLVVLLGLYYLSDGLRLYFVIKAMGLHVGLPYILKLVFVNIFVSNVTPLATGGGFVQVFYLNKKGVPTGEAMAATSIRTVLAALILFTLTLVVIFTDPPVYN